MGGRSRRKREASRGGSLAGNPRAHPGLQGVAGLQVRWAYSVALLQLCNAVPVIQLFGLILAGAHIEAVPACAGPGRQQQAGLQGQHPARLGATTLSLLALELQHPRVLLCSMLQLWARGPLPSLPWGLAPCLLPGVPCRGCDTKRNYWRTRNPYPEGSLKARASERNLRIDPWQSGPPWQPLPT